MIADCDCCGKRMELRRCMAFGIETYACDGCRADGVRANGHCPHWPDCGCIVTDPCAWQRGLSLPEGQ